MTRDQQIAYAAAVLPTEPLEFETPTEEVRRIMQTVATEPPSANEHGVWRDLYPLTDEEIAHIETLVYQRVLGPAA